MKRSKIFVKMFILIILACLLAVACENVTFSPLQGKWQLKTVEKEGKIITVDTVWYNFQSISLFSLQVYDPQKDTYYAYEGVRTQEEDVVSIRMIAEWVVDNSDWILPSRSFTIEKVNKKQLRLLSEEGYRYSFIKF